MANNQKVAVVVLPFPMQGHLTPFLHLSRRIAACGVPVHYVSSEAAIQQATVRSHGWDPSATANLHLRGHPTTPDQNVKDAATKGFQEPLSSLLTELASENHTRVVFIFDALLSSHVNPFASLPNVESYAFETSSAVTSYSAIWEANGKPELPAEAAEMMGQISSLEGCPHECNFRRVVSSRYEIRGMHSGTIFNTTGITEGFYLDLLAKLPPHRIWAVGPLNPVVSHARTNSECLDWLDKQPENSVVFVSFGTSSPISDVQIRQIAVGLERSGARFVWLLRNKDSRNMLKDEEKIVELPRGFEESVGERGIVVREWAPQLEILEHSATGGFVSHCGWNSCMESISMGVPIVALPLNADQPRNAFLMTKVLKVGVEVERTRKDELVSASKLANAVKRLMASEEGVQMRQRAVQLADSINNSMMDGGATVEMASFIAHITRN